ncbi:NADH-quinone oxidoreductase subunit NuoE [Candidatus Bipolaricaulota bacterium]|nr:NADH-quinone oxidoreductase subunit NuoE [Candidatus Bipolaricaulota bacterium]
MIGGATDQKNEALQQILDKFRGTDGPLIQVLHQAQAVFGYLPTDVQRTVANGLGLPLSTVNGVVTFYNFFRTEPRGEHVISICTGTACHVKGAERVIDMLSEMLGIGLEETTEDRKFTVQGVRCIGACGLAPVMMIDDEVYGKLDRKRIEEILASY